VSSDYTVGLVLEVARSQIGTTEAPVNDNPYGRFYGHNGQPWCAYFVSWCYHHADAPLPALESWMSDGFSYCPDAVRHAGITGEGVDPRSARPGDVVLYDWEPNGVSDHTGIITGSDESGVWAIEGNTSSTNSGSQTNGDGVYERGRPWSKVTAVWRPTVEAPGEEDYMQAQYLVQPHGSSGLWVKVRPSGDAELTAWFARWDAAQGVTNTPFGTSVLDVQAWLNKPLAGTVWLGQDPNHPWRFTVSDDNGDYAVTLLGGG
jgi:CHAP domain